MNSKFQKALENLVPFLMIGVAVALILGLVFMFFYIALWGLIIGAVLWLATLVKQYFFPIKPVKKESGRTIEHDNKK